MSGIAHFILGGFLGFIAAMVVICCAIDDGGDR